MAGSGKLFTLKGFPARSRQFPTFPPFRPKRSVAEQKPDFLFPISVVFGIFTGMAAPDPKRRWFLPTPGKLLLVLLAVEAILFFSKRWMPKGWAVLIAVAAVGVFLIGMLAVVGPCPLLPLAVSIQHSVAAAADRGGGDAVFSWLAVEMKWAKEQREAVKAIELAGGSVGYFGSGSRPPEPRWLLYLFGQNFFDDVSFVVSRWCDAGTPKQVLTAKNAAVLLC